MTTEILATLETATARLAGGRAQLVLVERTGPATSAELSAQLQERSRFIWTARCHRQMLQPFASLADLIEQVYEQAEAAGFGDLALPHWIALPLLAPALRERIPARHPAACFDYCPGEKRRRAAPGWVRRAFHGAIDFLFAVQDALGARPLVIGLLNLDQATPDELEFVALLLRRGRNRPMLIWATTAAQIPASLITEAERVGLPIERLAVNEEIPPTTAGLDLPSVPALVAASEEYSYHGAWRAVVNWSQIALARMTPDERPLLPTLLGALRVAYNGINQYMASEHLLLQQMAVANSLEERVHCLYHLAILHSLWQSNPERAVFYQDEAFRAVRTATTPEARAELMLWATHSAMMVWGRQGLARSLAEGQRTIAEFRRYFGKDRHRVQQAILLYGTAQAAEALGDDALSAEFYRQSLEADPHFPEYYHHYAATLNRLERYSEALQVCESAWDRTPPYHWLVMCRGRALQGLGRTQEALADFDRAIELEPTTAEHHLSRALLCHEMGALPDAIQSYTTYLELHPDDPEALANRGSARHDQGDPEGALTDLSRAIALSSDLMAALANRAAVLADLGRITEAKADLESALLLDPGNPLLLQNRDALNALG